MNKDEFLCPTCGGVLEVIDNENGVLKCRNCSNKIFANKKFAISDPAVKIKENVVIMDHITSTELEKKKEEKAQDISLKLIRVGVFSLDTLYVICAVLFISVLLVNNIETRLLDLTLLVIMVLATNLLAIMAIKIRFKNYGATIVNCVIDLLLIIGIMIISYLYIGKSYNLSDIFLLMC